MALQKRLDYGFHGYQLPPTPRAARSVRRRRGSFKRKAGDQQICAFDLLATVAGKLLMDGENCPPPANTSFTKGHAPFFIYTNTILKEENDERKARDRDVISRPISGIKTPDCSENIGPLVNDDCKLRLGIFTQPDVESSNFRLSTTCGPEEGKSEKDVKLEFANNRFLSISDKTSPYSSGLVENSDRKSSALVCSVNNNVKFPFLKDHAPCGSFPVYRDTVKLVNRDDDENSPTTRNKTIKPPQHFGERRLRKLLPSQHCRITSNVKDDGRYTSESISCPSKDNNLKCQRPLRDYPFKKRKLYDCGSVPTSDEGVTSQVTENGNNGEGLCSNPNPHRVKFKIKSFRVPELLIEIPETATVASLKKRVMEAVNAVLGSGLHVGVLLQGKKIRDDNKTLAETGISHDNKMGMLGFSLEPSSIPTPIRLYPEDRPRQLLCQSPQPLQNYPPQSGGGQRNLEHRGDVDGRKNLMECEQHDSGPSSSLGISSLQRNSSECKALTVSSRKADTMVVRKSKCSESGQRRIRRPFTVAEVEALVQAVEKLGTGRWRDVKLRAFDTAKHRTYVDLKDKWKTLVHTARISPQQRRGEPVPQELLDRVLTAHAYWSQQQQLKSRPDTCIHL
ncbi:Telomere repeat-binding protein 2 [Striga hermonthica]|uniref:Telomere repeat-binding protein 2 n=1 Tax=Striga hermonthica TaxID=68872 RepID=A0A9N7RD31_STRHE|nr:Telomere repeat-binding protein 2 [Striga hermonthica]